MNYDTYIPTIIHYWFGDAPDFDRWFNNGATHDKDITRKFAAVLRAAETGSLEHWGDSLDGFIAYIILTDQFSRQIYRGTAVAYSNDRNTLIFLEKHLDKYMVKLSAIQLLFVLMPFQHTENLDAQTRGVNILQTLYDNEPVLVEKNILKEALSHQKGHLKVIKRFSRFPKRNEYITSRNSTKEEIKYISDTAKLNLPY